MQAQKRSRQPQQARRRRRGSACPKRGGLLTRAGERLWVGTRQLALEPSALMGGRRCHRCFCTCDKVVAPPWISEGHHRAQFTLPVSDARVTLATEPLTKPPCHCDVPQLHCAGRGRCRGLSGRTCTRNCRVRSQRSTLTEALARVSSRRSFV